MNRGQRPKLQQREAHVMPPRVSRKHPSGLVPKSDYSARPNNRRLSMRRTAVAAAVITIAGLIGISAVNWAFAVDPEVPKPWFAPYADVSLKPSHSWEDPRHNPARDVVLSFIVADHASPCTPSWGGYFTTAQAATALELDRRIARVRGRGGDVIVSFGGARNSELATACTDVGALTNAYRTVIDRYDVVTVDLDIEGSNLTNVDGRQRRAEALATLQREARSKKRELAVWLTLAATTGGLPVEGVRMVDAVLKAGLDLSGVNIMTMNYGPSRSGNQSMLDATKAALRAGRRQVGDAYKRAGIRLRDKQVWAKIGATPMIGQNDVPTDLFSLEDATGLASFLRSSGMGRLSLWSLNRDNRCGPNTDSGQASDFCSGVEQKPLSFTGLLNQLQGRPASAAKTRTVPDTSREIVDDPALSPYPIWNNDRSYPEGRKLVWRGQVYASKWWNQHQLPDAPVDSENDTPWRLVGPVLLREKPIPTTTLAPGTYPAWDHGKAYDKGARILLDGVGYEAKWWVRGEPPNRDVPNEYDTAWKPLA